MTAATMAGFLGLVAAGCVSSTGPSVLPANDDATSQPAPQTANDRTSVPSRATTVRPDGDGLSISVTRVSDGDSLRATSSEGDLEIRLLGINAPESDECFGADAKDELTRLLDNADVTISPWPGERDEFGRQLGFLIADDVFVNLSLIETGHVVSRAQSDHGFDREFEEAEERAVDGGAGLWADDACGTPTNSQLRIVEVFENAPGDDRENPNGEYVVFVNDGDSTVDMDGWGLRDESTRHRFTFPSLDVPPGVEVIVRTGCGNNTPDTDPIEVFWCDPEPPVWNNGGDTAFLLDPNGAIADNFAVQG